MRWRRLADRATARFMRGSVLAANGLTALVAVGLLWKAWPVLTRVPLAELLFSSVWRPMKGAFGLWPFIVGTLEVTALAMVLAVPTCLLCAVYLSEYAPRKLRETVRPLMDILAGIPSVIFGLWGVLVVVPLVRAASGWFGGPPRSGYSILAGAYVLTVMVAPVIVAVSVEVLQAVPRGAREAALALGATRWETVRHVVVRRSLRGLAAAVVLGFTRAFGETMAVMMVVGNVAKIPGSLFDPAYPLTALIANNYGEVMSIPLYESALMTAALILMLVVAGFNLAAQLTLHRMERGVR